MQCNLHKIIFCLILGIGTESSLFGETVSTIPFQVGDAQLCFYPNGYVDGNAEPLLYQIVDNSNHQYGSRYKKVAVFCGRNTFADTDATIDTNLILPKFIFCDGELLPVAGIDGGFKNATARMIWLQDNVSRLEDFAFEGADNIASLTLPANLTYLGSESLANMESISAIYFRGTLPPDSKIDLTSQFSEIWSMGSSVGKMPDKYETPFGDSKTLSEVDPELGRPKLLVPEGTFSFYTQNPLFNGLSLRISEYKPLYPQIKATGIPEGMAFVAVGDFRAEIQDYPNAPAEVVLPAEISSFSYKMGYDMTKNPYRLAGIGKDFMSGQNGVEEIVIPEGVEYIKEGAFKGCSARRVSIGKDVRYIAHDVFADMPNLRDVEWTLPEGGYAYYSNDIFNNVASSATLHINVDSPLFDSRRAPFSNFRNVEGATAGIEVAETGITNLLTAEGVRGMIIVENAGVESIEAVIAGVSGQLLHFGAIAPGRHEISAQSGIYVMKAGSKTIKLIVK